MSTDNVFYEDLGENWSLHCTNLFHIDFKRPCGLTLRTGVGLDLLVGCLVEWSQDKVTFVTVVLDQTELRQNTGTTGDDTTGTDQLVQVELSVNRNRIIPVMIQYPWKWLLLDILIMFVKAESSNKHWRLKTLTHGVQVKTLIQTFSSLDSGLR